MGLSRNKVAVPEGAAGTPPFWRILKGVPDAARPKLMRGQVTQGTPPFWSRALKQSKPRNIEASKPRSIEKVVKDDGLMLSSLLVLTDLFVMIENE